MTKLMTMALAAIVLVSTMTTSADAGWRRRCCCQNFGYGGGYGFSGGQCVTGLYGQQNWQTAYQPQSFQNFCAPVSYSGQYGSQHSGQTVDPYYSR